VILGLVEDAVAAGARRERACMQVGLDERSMQRWRRADVGEDGRAGPRTSPANALTSAERAHVLAVVNSPEYRDLPPKQVVPRLADTGNYCASESTIYRILRSEGQLTHRGRAKPRTVRCIDEHQATAPNQVWSWDITYLLSAVRGRFFYLYLVEDVWSRRIMGFEVHEEESMESAAALVRTTCATAGVDPRGLVLHSDNGGPMRGSTMLATLQHQRHPLRDARREARRTRARRAGQPRTRLRARPAEKPRPVVRRDAQLDRSCRRLPQPETRRGGHRRRARPRLIGHQQKRQLP
jgi:hypothetical protein